MGATALDPRTPVLVGVAATSQRTDDPGDAMEAAALVARAVRDAAVDAGAPALVDRIELVLVPEGTWSYPDLGRLVGAPATARTVRAEIGVLQQTLLTRAAAAIAAGDADVVLVCGGEAKHRALRAAITGVPAPETEQPGVAADEVLRPAADVIPPVEIERELAWPVRQYALVEHALWAASTDGPDVERRRLHELWAGFAAVAAANPRAWSRDPVTAHDLAAAPLLSSPYSKRHASQWNVDQAAALILTSTEVADRLGVPLDRRVFPHLGVESNHMVALTERAELHRSHAMAAAAAAVRRHTSWEPAEIAHLDLYSCFPVAVRLQCREMGIDPTRTLTVTGGMAFAGGPLNNYVLQAMVTMAETLRAHPDDAGLVSSVCGMLTKFGLGVWAGHPAEAPFRDAPFRGVDVTAEVAAATTTVAVDPDHVGPAALVAATVVHEHGVPTCSIVLGDTPAGTRAVATSLDPAVGALLCTPDGRAAPTVVCSGPSVTLP